MKGSLGERGGSGSEHQRDSSKGGTSTYQNGTIYYGHEKL